MLISQRIDGMAVQGYGIVFQPVLEWAVQEKENTEINQRFKTLWSRKIPVYINFFMLSCFTLLIDCCFTSDRDLSYCEIHKIMIDLVFTSETWVFISLIYIQGAFFIALDITE